MNAQDYLSFKNEDAIEIKMLSKHCCRKPALLNCENKFINCIKLIHYAKTIVFKWCWKMLLFPILLLLLNVPPQHFGEKMVRSIEPQTKM